MTRTAVVWPRAPSAAASAVSAVPCFELDRPFLREEVRRRDGLLHVEMPVEHADERLHDEADDLRAARRADEQPEPPAVVEHDRRRHRAQRPFAALDAVRDGLAAAFGRVVEVRELVVQDETADHELAAERALHARGHRHCVAALVDDREVARRRALRGRGRREVPRDPGRRAGLSRLGSALFESIAAARAST